MLALYERPVARADPETTDGYKLRKCSDSRPEETDKTTSRPAPRTASAD